MNTNGPSKRILCYGDSNTRGRVPASMGTQRFGPQQRRPGIVQDLLGENFEIIEEGLGGRTTAFDDPRPEFPERNGLKTLPIILESHLPLDLVIVMLGTTDTKEMMNLSCEEITEGMKNIITTIKKYKVLTGFSVPKILIIVPPVVKEDADFASKLFKGGTAKGNELRETYKKLAGDEQAMFLDPNGEIQVDQNEGVHLDSVNHKKLAEILFGKIQANF